MKSSVIAKIFIFIIIVALFYIGWSYFGPEAGPSNKIRNVVLISMDTTRADIFSCYNPGLFEQDTTPNIDALAAESVLFERVYAPLSLTLPSHCTMLTGTIPPYHGIHDNLNYKLNDSNVTLAEILKDNGFTTGAIIGSIILDSKYGLDQGFDSYDDNFQNERSPIRIPERQAEETRRIANQWLDEHQKERMFLFLHFYDPHQSYDAPEPYHGMFLDNPHQDPNSLKDPQANYDYMQGLYAGEVAYTDNCIKGIIDKLKQLGLYDSTLIIITADHGEMFHQHKEVSHGYYIYEGNVRIPLIFKVPGVSTPRRVEKTVGHIDIAPTVCSLLDIEGTYTFQGVDITPYLLQDEPEDLKREIYLESLTPTKYKANSLLGIVNDKYKYIQTTRPELYDMINDYPESINLVEDYPKVTHLLKGRLKLMLDDVIASGDADSKMELDEETLKQLEALGYVSGSVTEDFTFDTSKKDPKDLIDYHLLNTRIRQALVEEKFDLAREMCEKMISMQPEVYRPYFHLAAIANRLEDYPEAIKQLKKVIEIEPDNIEGHNFLATIYQKQNNREQAIEQHIISLKIKPKQPAVLNQLAAQYTSLKKTEKAIDCFNKSLQIAPKQPAVMSELAMALHGQGKVAKALTLWSDSLEIYPNQPYAINSLAWIKATSKDENFYNLGEALTFAQRACELTEHKDPGMLDTLAAALAANGQFDKAVETADKAIQLAKSTDQNDLVGDLERHRNLYKMRQKLRE
jgi:arylsulfatase A-like enzyme/Flp pilus assembly protein TadD